jgi:hypothetical protein
MIWLIARNVPRMVGWPLVENVLDNHTICLTWLLKWRWKITRAGRTLGNFILDKPEAYILYHLKADFVSLGTRKGHVANAVYDAVPLYPCPKHLMQAQKQRCTGFVAHIRFHRNK